MGMLLDLEILGLMDALQLVVVLAATAFSWRAGIRAVRTLASGSTRSGVPGARAVVRPNACVLPLNATLNAVVSALTSTLLRRGRRVALLMAAGRMVAGLNGLLPVALLVGHGKCWAATPPAVEHVVARPTWSSHASLAVPAMGSGLTQLSGVRGPHRVAQ